MSIFSPFFSLQVAFSLHPAPPSRKTRHNRHISTFLRISQKIRHTIRHNRHKTWLQHGGHREHRGHVGNCVWCFGDCTCCSHFGLVSASPFALISCGLVGNQTVTLLLGIYSRC